MLFDLVLEGRKTATCCLREDINLLTVNNSISILTNFDKSKKAKIKTIKKYICKFCDITEEHVFKEGEGDLSLNHWQEAFRKFFTERLSNLSNLSKSFDENIELVCEEFVIIK